MLGVREKVISPALSTVPEERTEEVRLRVARVPEVLEGLEETAGAHGRRRHRGNLETY
jgi:hypothetical protein